MNRQRYAGKIKRLEQATEEGQQRQNLQYFSAESRNCAWNNLNFIHITSEKNVGIYFFV